MTTMENLDPSTPLMAQLREQTGPIVVVNTLFVPREYTKQFLANWQHESAFMKSRPGFISAQLHQGTGGSQLFANVAVWESTEALARTHAEPEFRQRVSHGIDGMVVYPHIYQKIAVDGICVA
jgi:heme-degrading monooxygenase HmoA